MHLHEYQAKRLLADYGVPVPAGKPAMSVQEAVAAAQDLGGNDWVVKAQVHAGGRGKAGGVRRVDAIELLEKAADELLGSQLVTAQTGRAGLPVNTLLIEQATPVQQEFYLGALIDRGSQRVVFMASRAGGMDIEQVAAERPDEILRVAVDPVVGLQAYQCRRIAFGLGLAGQHLAPLSRLMQALYRLFTEQDLSLVEINPLVLTRDNGIVALDAKVNIDENALYRHSELAALRDVTQEDAKEHAAHQHGLNYITLDGNIACMVNGAGLAMATMDLIKLHGGQPANFLDVGGGTDAARVAEAFKLILSDDKVQAILVNIFGGIVRCDLIAEGIIRAVQEVNVSVPVVVRLEGTNAEQGRALLDGSGLSIIAADGLTDAAKKAIAAARKHRQEGQSA